MLHSPYNLKINIKNAIKNKYGSKLELVKFKSDFCALFWNFIWYCKVKGLDYSIILPYTDNMDQIRLNKYIHNKNLNCIKLIYNNDFFNSMEYKLKEVQSGVTKNNKKRGSVILDNKFQELEEEKVESFEIGKISKLKQKKFVGKIISGFLSQNSFDKGI